MISLSSGNLTRLKCAPGYLFVSVFTVYLTYRCSSWARASPAAAALCLTLCWASLSVALALGLWFMPVWCLAVPTVAKNTAESSSAACGDTSPLGSTNAQVRPRLLQYLGLCICMGFFEYGVTYMGLRYHMVRTGKLQGYGTVQWVMLGVTIGSFLLTTMLAGIIIVRRPRYTVPYQDYQMS